MSEPVWTGIERILEDARRAASSEATLLITGETGVGKEVLANWVHEHSKRARGPFRAVDTASRPTELIASELFGHVKGAFTGAYRANDGCFRACQGGTVFLDEIGDLSLENQAKLRRVLQNRMVEPLGGDTALSVDVRVIAATNVNLEEAVKAQRFRSDLYYRLNTIRLDLPPLRKRRGAIPELARRFLTEKLRRNGKGDKSLLPDAIEWLQNLPWLGNIREIENFMERVAVLVEATAVTAADLASLSPDTEYEGSCRMGEEVPGGDELRPFIDAMAPGATPAMRARALRVAEWIRVVLLEQQAGILDGPAGKALMDGLAMRASNPLLSDFGLALASVVAWDLKVTGSSDLDPLLDRWGASLGKAQEGLGPLRSRVRNLLSLVGIGAKIPERPLY
jgi:transcriptional regulator with GAF, ATPase, and Fis domain